MHKLVPPLVASLLLGLAPFGAEPHLVGKIRWVLGGARGMAPLDWFDLLMHGAPLIWLAVALVQVIRERRGPQGPDASDSPDAPEGGSGSASAGS